MQRNAFTLIEMLIVIGIIVVIGLVVSLNLTGSRNKNDLMDTVQQMVSLLREAQSRSMALDGGTAWGVSFVNSTSGQPYFTLFQLVVATVTPAEQRYLLPKDVAYATSSIAQGASSSISFATVTGFPSASTSLQINGVVGSSVVSSSTISIGGLGTIGY